MGLVVDALQHGILYAYLEERSDQVGLTRDVGVTWEGKELGERCVGWRKDGDVLSLAQSSNDVWLPLENS